MVFWLFGDDRSVTSAVARSVAIQAEREIRLVSSFFFAWSGNQESRDPANLIPTVAYGIAQFDIDMLRMIAESIAMYPDLRDKGATTQVSMLLKRPFMDMANRVHFDLPALIVIDALDTCTNLDDPRIAADVALLIETLAAKPLRIKLLITSRFPRAIEIIADSQNFPRYGEFAIAHDTMTDHDQTASVAIPGPSNVDSGASHLSTL